MILLVLLACGGAPNKAATDDTSAAMPSEYLVDDPAPITLNLSGEEAGAAIDEVFGRVIPSQGAVVFDAYDEVMTYADGVCPGSSATADTEGTMWNATCTAASGASYTGFISTFRGQQGEVYASNMRGEATVTTPDGARLVVAGDVHTTVQETQHKWYSSVDGVLSYDGPAGQGTWLADTVAVSVAYTLLLDANDHLVRAEVEGFFGPLDGAVSAINFDGIEVAHTLDNPCPEEPAGIISVRDANGTWGELVFDLTFAPDGSGSIEDGLCDGCGTLWFDGVAVDTVCVDPQPLYDAQTPPW